MCGFGVVLAGVVVVSGGGDGGYQVVSISC